MSTAPNKTLSPVFWEAMIKMPPARLARTLEAGLKRDPVWITDQALCAAKNVRLVSEEYGILTDFCHAHYSEVSQKNLSKGIEAAIAGLEAVSGDPEKLEQACDDVLGIFRQLAVFNSKKAISAAYANKAGLGTAHPLYGALTEFLLENLDDDDYDMFRHIAHSAAQLSPDSRMGFVRTLETLQDSRGYGIDCVLENLLIACADLYEDPAVQRAQDMLAARSQGLPMQVITSTKPPETPKPDYKKDGNVITLHPRRDP